MATDADARTVAPDIDAPDSLDEHHDFEREFVISDTDHHVRSAIADTAAAAPGFSFDALKAEYAHLWAEMAIRRERLAEIDNIVDRIVRNKDRYLKVEHQTGVPWFAVGTIHTLEASGNFTKHLHNGDPLTARTVHVPAGRPAMGNPPFTWEESAVDALTLHKLDQVAKWTIERLAYEFERYNGFGYRQYHPEVKSPYVWSFSNLYTSGKYVADGRWSPTAVSAQCGAMVLVKRLHDNGHIELTLEAGSVPSVDEDTFMPVPVNLPVILARSTMLETRPLLERGSVGDAVGTLQAMLRTLHYDIAVDRDFGPATELAVKMFQREHGLRPDGIVGPDTWAALDLATGTGSAQPTRYWPVGRGHRITSPFGPRPGGFHTGTDFGFPGGSAGKPVYAVQSGTVKYSGGAQGYGGPDPAGWLVILSTPAEGTGCVEYGHIVREVAQGQHVTAGQRIARINPSMQTNGGVPPHLHLSVMPRDYDPRTKMDPIPWLGDALSPEPGLMT